MNRPPHIKNPAPATLARYGLSIEEWLAMAEAHLWGCHCCGRYPPKRLVIDHEHIAGWKRMEAAERLAYVRGLTCDSCNHYVLTRYADANKHRAAADYLDRYAARKAK